VATTTTSDPSRRDVLYIATGAMAAVGAGAVAWPLVYQMWPDASTIAAGAPIELDIGAIPEGQTVKTTWRGKTIFVTHRTAADVDAAKKDDAAAMPDPATDASRVKKPEWLVVIGVCTHLGCIPLNHQGDYPGGYFCPCHGSHYDTSGRIRKGPAPLNLPVPPYSFASEKKLVIGAEA
jgi:ubiquinol-cytochrome c reductase iron-sulfur subunit